MTKFLPFFLLLFLTKIGFSQVNLNSGLVAYYPFNGDANDASGNSNNPIFNNATLTSDRFGNANSAYSFNGVDNYIQIPSSISLNTGAQISLCVYVNIQGFYSGPCHGNDIINKGQYGGNTNFYFIRFDDYAYTNGGNCSSPVDNNHQNFYGHYTSVPTPGYSPYIAKNEWYCLVYTYDGSTAKFFVDGNLKSQYNISGLSFGNADDLYLGRLYNPSDPSSFPYWFNGTMDEVRIYNRAINDQEVSALCIAPCSNIDSVRVNYNETTCKAFDFKGMAFVKSSPISTWKWSFGDGGIDSIQNTTHVYSTSTTFPVKLVVTDINGCMDSITVSVLPSGINTTKGNDTTICKGSNAQLFASGGSTYSWTPTSTLNNPNIFNPVATPADTTTYYVTVTNVSGCSKIDSIKIFIKPLPIISISSDTSVCNNTPVQLFANGGSTYSWTPASTLNNPTINNPVATPASTTTYQVVVTNSTGCSNKDSVKIITSPLPVISKSNDTSICNNTSVQLFASGGSSYLWTPSSGLSNQNINNPVATPVTTTTWYVTVTNNPGCFKKDSVKTRKDALNIPSGKGIQIDTDEDKPAPAKAPARKNAFSRFKDKLKAEEIE